MPIGDAFLVWAKTARPWVAAVPAAPPPSISWWWRAPLLALLTLLALLPWTLAIWRRLRPRPMSAALDEPVRPRS
jgi:hypothetical protein